MKKQILIIAIILNASCALAMDDDSDNMYCCTKLKNKYGCDHNYNTNLQGILKSALLTKPSCSGYENCDEAIAHKICCGADPNQVITAFLITDKQTKREPTNHYICPLEYSVKKSKNSKLAKFLLKYKANPDIKMIYKEHQEQYFAKDDRGIDRRPLIFSAETVDMAKALVEGKCLEIKDSDKVVHDAVKFPHINSEVVEYYLTVDPNLANIVDKLKRIPLHALAASPCYNKKKDMPEFERKARILLKHTKNIYSTDFLKETPMDIAKRNARYSPARLKLINILNSMKTYSFSTEEQF